MKWLKDCIYVHYFSRKLALGGNLYRPIYTVTIVTHRNMKISIVMEDWPRICFSISRVGVQFIFETACYRSPRRRLSANIAISKYSIVKELIRWTSIWRQHKIVSITYTNSWNIMSDSMTNVVSANTLLFYLINCVLRLIHSLCHIATNGKDVNSAVCHGKHEKSQWKWRKRTEKTEDRFVRFFTFGLSINPPSPDHSNVQFSGRGWFRRRGTCSYSDVICSSHFLMVSGYRRPFISSIT